MTTSIGDRARQVQLLLGGIAVLIIAMTACGSSEPVLPGLGDSVSLSVGGSAEFDTGDGRALVHFISLDADSRCPSGAQCIVAGEATITLGLTIGDGDTLAFPVILPPNASVRSELAGFTLTLTSLLPDPPPERVSDSLYRALLVLTRQ